MSVSPSEDAQRWIAEQNMQHMIENMAQGYRRRTFFDGLGDAVVTWGKSVGDLFEGTFSGNWEQAREGLKGTTFGKSEKVFEAGEGLFTGDWDKLANSVGEFVGLDEDARAKMADGNIGAGFLAMGGNNLKAVSGAHGSIFSANSAFVDELVGIDGMPINFSFFSPGTPVLGEQLNFAGTMLNAAADALAAYGDCDACHKSSQGIFKVMGMSEKYSDKGGGKQLTRKTCQKLTARFKTGCGRLMKKQEAKAMCIPLTTAFQFACPKLVGRLYGKGIKEIPFESSSFQDEAKNEMCKDSCKLKDDSDRFVKLKHCVSTAKTQYGKRVKAEGLNSVMPLADPEGPPGCFIDASESETSARFNNSFTPGSKASNYTPIRSMLKRCEGNCHSNDECSGDLICYPSHKDVPGCSGEGTEGHKYCTKGPGENGSVWAIGKPGETCAQVCQFKGLSCNSHQLGILDDKFKSAGIQCTSVEQTPTSSPYGATVDASGVCSRAGEISGCEVKDVGLLMCEKACKDNAECKSYSYFGGSPDPKKCLVVKGGQWTQACEDALNGQKQCILSKDEMPITVNDSDSKKQWTTYNYRLRHEASAADRASIDAVGNLFATMGGSSSLAAIDAETSVRWSNGIVPESSVLEKIDIAVPEPDPNKRNICLCQSHEAKKSFEKKKIAADQIMKTAMQKLETKRTQRELFNRLGYEWRKVREGEYCQRSGSKGQIRVYNGNDLPVCDSGDERCYAEKCADKCRYGVYGPPGDNPSYSDSKYKKKSGGFGTMKGFFIRPSDGRCYCRDESFAKCEGASAKKMSNGYNHYDLTSWVKMEDGKYCRDKTGSSWDGKGMMRVFDGKESDNLHERKCLYGNEACYVSRCAVQCQSGKYGPSGSNPSWSAQTYRNKEKGFGGDMKGFFINSKGRCYCTDQTYRECKDSKNGVQKSGYDHYDLRGFDTETEKAVKMVENLFDTVSGASKKREQLRQIEQLKVNPFKMLWR